MLRAKLVVECLPASRRPVFVPAAWLATRQLSHFCGLVLALGNRLQVAVGWAARDRCGIA